MKLKVCGMNHNIAEVADIMPDYLGFIFWDKSSRFFDGEIPTLPETLKKVGVFVDASIDEILYTISKYSLDAIQLHGDESMEYCNELKHRLLPSMEIIKVFSVKNEFDFSVLKSYEFPVDYFLFDTKGELPGGNGYTFDWSVLKNYPSTKPYFLSGGIGPESIQDIRNFLKRPEATYCHALDVNSKFEDQPGLKNIEKLKQFKAALSI